MLDRWTLSAKTEDVLTERLVGFLAPTWPSLEGSESASEERLDKCDMEILRRERPHSQPGPSSLFR